MTKDEFLLKVLSECWSCVEDNEVEEGLRGAQGITEKQVQAHYPEWKNDVDEDDDDEDYDAYDKRQEIVMNVMKDVSDLLKRLKAAAKEKNEQSE